jgi:CRISPR/Cas system CSM-associated protein Csm2 small subunit
MSTRSRFYNTIYTPFKNKQYDVALNNVLRYQTAQTSAGFRRIYDVVIRTLAVVKGERRQEDPSLPKQLARLDILIEYQKNRGVLERDLADGIKAALAEIRRDLGKDVAKEEAEALEMALNAVLAYKIIASRRREEEEEELL